MPSKYAVVSGVLFGVVAVLQAVRALYQWPVKMDARKRGFARLLTPFNADVGRLCARCRGKNASGFANVACFGYRLLLTSWGASNDHASSRVGSRGSQPCGA